MDFFFWRSGICSDEQLLSIDSLQCLLVTLRLYAVSNVMQICHVINWQKIILDRGNTCISFLELYLGSDLNVSE